MSEESYIPEEVIRIFSNGLNGIQPPLSQWQRDLRLARAVEGATTALAQAECCGNSLRGCEDCPPPKKLTFEEWWEGNKSTNFWSEEDLAQSVWQAAQENKE